MEFPIDGSSPFAPVLAAHNARQGTLARMRGVVADNAEALARDLLHEFAIRAGGGAAAHWGAAGRGAEIARALARPRPGSARAFDPWTGAWQGRWRKPSPDPEVRRGRMQFHVWDETQATAIAGRTQHVQAVTQSRGGFRLAGDIDPLPADTNLAINVWSPRDGITGWVAGNGRADPHVGWLLNPHTLIWVMQFGVADRLADRFGVFFEWVGPAHGAYGISGRIFRLRPAAGLPSGHRLVLDEEMPGHGTYRPPGGGAAARLPRVAHDRAP